MASAPRPRGLLYFKALQTPRCCSDLSKLPFSPWGWPRFYQRRPCNSGSGTPQNAEESAKNQKRHGENLDVLCTTGHEPARCKRRISPIFAEKRPSRRQNCMAGADRNAARNGSLETASITCGNARRKQLEPTKTTLRTP